jgi:Domain of unknown function (DUF1707)
MSVNEPDAGTSRVRASDADRERAVDDLRRHHEEGRLDSGEFTERMEAALSARWLDQLPRLLSDLPDPRRSETVEDIRHFHLPVHGQWRRYAPALGPVVATLLIVGVLGSAAAIANGRFPFALLWLLFGLFAVKPWLRRRFREINRQHGA